MMKRSLALLALLLTACVTHASEVEADFKPSSWAQGGPYSLPSLKNKLVMLYFYEEG